MGSLFEISGPKVRRFGNGKQSRIERLVMVLMILLGK